MSLSFVSFVLIRYLHFIAVIALFVLLLAEFVQMKPTLSGKSLRRLANTDLAYWLAGILVLLSGTLLTVSVGKGMDFYIHNPVYLFKVGLFLAAVAATLYPTVFLQTRRSSDPTDIISVPAVIRLIIRVKILVLLSLPLLAVLMAQGIGLNT